MKLQWGTFTEAAEEVCLGRMWGGIHSPVDDIKGLRLGYEVADLVWKEMLKLLEAKPISPPFKLLHQLLKPSFRV